MALVLVLYDERSALVRELAAAVAQGVAQVEGATPRLCPLAQARQEHLLEADAIILGSPNWSGVTGRLKLWLDEQGDLWEEGSLAGKVGAAFTAARGRHSGVEFTLLALLHWLLACGLVVVGLPWSPRMETSGAYYGATATGGVTEADREQARSLGRRVAQVACRLRETRSPRPP